MFHMPMSSPMMTRMFGFFADEVGVAVAVVVTAAACARRTFLAAPSERQGGWSTP
jgi:hypothetical protein